LRPEQFQVIQREPGLEQQLYDGRHTALAFLEDVRPGDVIDYSYTVRGRSPLFANRFVAEQPHQLPAAVGRMRHRIVLEPGRQLHTRAHGTSNAPEIHRESNGTVIVWDRTDVPAARIDSDLPDWFRPLPTVQVSEFEDWADVARWASELFRLDDRAQEGARRVAAEIARQSDEPRERTRLALRFVQSEIRYVAIELGEASFQPTPPGEVLDRRFGDCKDKAVLLVALLGELGIRADPALVNSVLRAGVLDQLPSPTVFDHAIVRVTLGEDELWVDPTLDERGPINESSLPNYGYALPVTPRTTELAGVLRDTGSSARIRVARQYSIRDDKTATLDVHTVYEGGDANSIRGVLGWLGIEKFSANCLEAAVGEHPSLKLRDALHVKDDESRNLVRVHERYFIKNFWEHQRDDGLWGAFGASDVSSCLWVPSQRSRETPIGMRHPNDVAVTIVASLPGAFWDIDESEQRIQNAAFDFRQRVTYGSNQLQLEYAYRSLGDHVRAEEVARYCADVERVWSRMGFELPAPTVPVRAGLYTEQADLGEALVGVAFLGLLIVAAVLASRRRASRRRGELFLQPAGLEGEPLHPFLEHALEPPTVWREGRLLVMEPDQELPERCVFCNGARARSVPRTLQFVPPWTLVLLLAPLLYVIVAVCIRKKAKVSIGLCDEHWRRHRRRLWSAFGVGVAGLVAIATGAHDDGGMVLVPLGIAAVLVAWWMHSRVHNVLGIHLIDDRVIELKGAGKPFLESLRRRAA
jgi:transglutaminase-like putative cysteine protease